MYKLDNSYTNYHLRWQYQQHWLTHPSFKYDALRMVYDLALSSLEIGMGQMTSCYVAASVLTTPQKSAPGPGTWEGAVSLQYRQGFSASHTFETG